MKEIPGFPQYYATEDGQIWSGKTHRFLKQRTFYKTYLRVPLSINGKFYLRRVHRLVALAYHPNPLNLPEVNHKDGNTQNNRSENLEWCTRKDNLKHFKESR